MKMETSQIGTLCSPDAHQNVEFSLRKLKKTKAHETDFVCATILPKGCATL